jgi:hypothetical protein
MAVAAVRARGDLDGLDVLPGLDGLGVALVPCAGTVASVLAGVVTGFVGVDEVDLETSAAKAGAASMVVAISATASLRNMDVVLSVVRLRKKRRGFRGSARCRSSLRTVRVPY